jgi:AraC family transcriptional regulator
MVVRQEFEKLGLHPESVSLGEVVLTEDNIPADLQNRIDESLLSLGFERIDDRKARLVDGIKNEVIRIIHHGDMTTLKFSWSKKLAEHTHHDYPYLSSLFSAMEGITIEHYIIRQKIEYVKELLFYNELTLSEIADKLGYSSVAHLSAQFKKITGLTPTEMKKSREIAHARKPLDNVTQERE